MQYLRTNSDLCHLQHKLPGFFNPDGKCLQRGTDWGFKHSSLRFVCKGLIMWALLKTKVLNGLVIEDDLQRIWKENSRCNNNNNIDKFS